MLQESKNLCTRQKIQYFFLFACIETTFMFFFKPVKTAA